MTLNDDFEYENRLEHQIFLWPKNLPEFCEYCDEEGHHASHSCSCCGQKGCKRTMIYDKDSMEWFCDEECLKNRLKDDGYEEQEVS